MSTKESVIEMIKNLPKKATLPDIMSELYFRYKIDRGLEQLDKGKGIPHVEVKARLKKWLH